MNLFSNSINIEISDIFILLGPSRDNMSREEDFSNDPKQCFYDCDDQITNIVMMHEIVEDFRKEEVKKRKETKKAAKMMRKMLRMSFR